MKKIFIGGCILFIICSILTSVGVYFGYTEFIQKPQQALEFNDELVDLQAEALERSNELDTALLDPESADEISTTFTAYEEDMGEIVTRIEDVSFDGGETFKQAVIDYVEGLVDANRVYYVDGLANILFDLNLTQAEFDTRLNELQEEFVQTGEQFDNEIEEIQENFAEEFRFEIEE